MDLYLYVVDNWVPFPASEYGGIILVAAHSDEDCVSLLTGWNYQDYDNEFNHLIPEHVRDAHKILIDKRSETKRGILTSFLT